MLDFRLDVEDIFGAGDRAAFRPVGGFGHRAQSPG